MHRGDLPRRHVALGMIGGVTISDGDVGPARNFQNARRILNSALHQFATAELHVRVGKGALKIHHDHGGAATKTDLAVTIADFFICIRCHNAHSLSLRYQVGQPR